MDNSFTISAILTFIILAYLIISYLTPDPTDNIIEGYTTQSSSGAGVSSIPAVDAIKTLVQKQKDIFLIPKYHDNYEKIILQADELLSIQMLNQVIALTNAGTQNEEIVGSIVKLKEAKDALSDVLKYNDAAAKK
jgi:hypothetical protein